MNVKVLIIRVRVIAGFNHEKIRHPLNIFFSHAPPALESVIDCVTVTTKRRKSNHHLGTRSIQRSLLASVFGRCDVWEGGGLAPGGCVSPSPLNWIPRVRTPQLASCCLRLIRYVCTWRDVRSHMQKAKVSRKWLQLIRLWRRETFLRPLCQIP